MFTERAVLVIVFLILASAPYGLRRYSRSRSSAHEAFIVGDRRNGWFRITAGLSATFVGGAAVINLAGLGYSFGWYALADVVPTSAALLLSAWVLVPLIRQRRAVSLGSYLRGGGDRVAGIAVGLLSAVVYTLITAAQLVALIKVVQPYFPVPGILLAGGAAAAVVAYLIYGGYASVTTSDVLQFVLTGSGYFLLVGVALALGANGIAQSPAISTQTMSTDLILLLALPILFVPVSQDLHIRVQSARNDADASCGAALAGVCYLVFGLISISVGRLMAARGVVLSNPDDAVPQFLQAQFGALALIPTAAVLVVVISSMDSVLFSSASSLAYDMWDVASPPGEKHAAHRARITTVFVAVVALFIALRAPGVLRLILSALVIYVSVLFPMLIGRATGRAPRGLGIIGLVALVIVTSLEAFGFTLPFRAFVYAAVAAACTLLLPRRAAAVA